jgi:hypothetical protein
MRFKGFTKKCLRELTQLPISQFVKHFVRIHSKLIHMQTKFIYAKFQCDHRKFDSVLKPD